MNIYILGIITGILITVGFWLINRWYWKSMYLAERDYSNKLKNLFEQNHPFKITRRGG